MEKHYLVVNSFVGLMGFTIVKGDIGVPGDSATAETWAAINEQVKAGNLRAIGEGERGREPLSRFEFNEERKGPRIIRKEPTPFTFEDDDDA